MIRPEGVFFYMGTVDYGDNRIYIPYRGCADGPMPLVKKEEEERKPEGEKEKNQPEPGDCPKGGAHLQRESWFYALEGSYYFCEKCGKDLGVARPYTGPY
ncbi:MAG: hypothetical protein AAB420_02545 [Patescibacteria group bacterium]